MTIPNIPVVPEDLSSLDDNALHALLAEFGTAAKPFSEIAASDHTDESIAAITALSEAVAPVTAEYETRQAKAEATSAAAGVASALAAFSTEFQTEDETDEDAEEDVEDTEASVTAATPKAPSVADIKRKRKTPEPKHTEPAWAASMVASADVKGFTSGQALTTWDEASKALESRHASYGEGKGPIAKGGKTLNREIQVIEATNIPRDARSMDVKRVHKIERFTRHGGVQLRTDAPTENRLNSRDDRGNAERLDNVSREARLNGGSLVASMVANVDKGTSLVAAAGWCAPSETIYDLAELETMDGMFSWPSMVADRGGFNIPTDGGPDFSSIFTGIGNAGDTHLTEAEVIADTEKVCVEVPCPPFTDVRLGVDYVCLTGSLLQRRGYPEAVGRFHRGALVALAHKINAGKIAAVVAGSTAGGTIPPSVGGDDAASSLLSAVDLAITDIKYRARMGTNATVVVDLPLWVLTQIRAAMSRRRGTAPATMATTDAEIAAWFAVRNAVPNFGYDWQDAFTGLAAGPGGATPLTALPTTVQFTAYPAGTWVEADAEVVDLDTIYDSTQLTTNQYTAAFAETGWAMLKMGPISRVYTASVDPTGCLCDGTTSP